MIKSIVAALLSRFATGNVDSAIASFNKSVDRLQLIAAKNLKKAAEAAQVKAKAEAKELLAKAEAERAKTVAEKIKALVG